MLATDPRAEAVWLMLEELYLKDDDEKDKTRYHSLTDDEKRATLRREILEIERMADDFRDGPIPLTSP
jgi:predicted component of type VI protein secretion system